MKVTNLKYLLVVSFLLIALKGNGQTVLLEYNRQPEDSLEADKGPNTKNYARLFLGMGILLGNDDDQMPHKVWPSFDLNYGIRYKRKLTEWYSAGAELSLRVLRYRIEQTDSKQYPDENQYDREELVFNNLELGLYNRFHFSDRGNSMGVFWDVGGSFGWTFSVMNQREYENDDGQEAELSLRKLDYPKDFNYFINTRIGYNQIMLMGSYRLSDLFKPSYPHPELPRYSVGIQVGLGN